MTWRLVWFVSFQLLGLALGAWMAGAWGAALGCTAAVWAWFIWDFSRGVRVLRWMRSTDLAAAPQLRGLWGEVADRARRWLVQSEKTSQKNAGRLQEVLAALQATPNGVVLLDRQSRIEWCNAIAAKHFDLDNERDVMQTIGNLVREPEFSAYYSHPERWAQGVMMAGWNSTPAHPVRLQVHLYSYANGRKLMLSHDVTAREQAEVMRRDFVANVSHEIRTPLTVLSGFVETMQHLQLDDEERARYLNLMAQQATRMQNVVQGLLTLSRLEGSPLPGNTEWQPVSQLLARCLEEGRGLSALLHGGPGQAQKLIFPSEESLENSGQVAASSAELQSAFTNLINNAIRYTPAGGTVEVSWQPQLDGTAVFTVRDTGVGIAAEHVPRVTERFYRIDRSRSRDTGGTGLGLAIVKHVVQRHGASLNITSSLGKGSTFSVTIPASRLRAAP